MDLAHELGPAAVRPYMILGVSILVLMDLAHEFTPGNLYCGPLQVSILVLMDLAHE